MFQQMMQFFATQNQIAQEQFQQRQEAMMKQFMEMQAMPLREQREINTSTQQYLLDQVNTSQENTTKTVLDATTKDISQLTTVIVNTMKEKDEAKMKKRKEITGELNGSAEKFPERLSEKDSCTFQEVKVVCNVEVQ